MISKSYIQYLTWGAIGGITPVLYRVIANLIPHETDYSSWVAWIIWIIAIGVIVVKHTSNSFFKLLVSGIYTGLLISAFYAISELINSMYISIWYDIELETVMTLRMKLILITIPVIITTFIAFVIALFKYFFDTKREGSSAN